MLNAKKGRLLISEPSLDDPSFFKSIILITHHSTEESIGIILNQKTEINLHDIFSNLPKQEFPIYIGGPVERNSIQFIHTLGNIIDGSKVIHEGLYWGGDFDKIISLIRQKKITKKQIRFFAGYAGWSEGQLNHEIRENGWLVNQSNISLCMQYSNEKLWSDIMKTKKEKYAIWANMPKNPSLN